MKRFLALVFAASMLASCQTTGMIRADAIDGPANRIADRHDAYVKEDSSLSNEERAIYLRSSELLRRIIAEAGQR